MKSILFTALGLFLTLPAMAASEGAKKTVETVPMGEAEVMRVGGTYKVTDINELDKGAYEIIFTSTQKSGRFDVLRLESDHIHVAVQRGSVVRLSAEVMNDQGIKADVAQMVLFLPNPKGPTPVWMLSNKAPNRDLRAVKYLDMHVPLNDYRVM